MIRRPQIICMDDRYATEFLYRSEASLHQHRVIVIVLDVQYSQTGFLAHLVLVA